MSSALQPCLDCGHLVSPSARRCPECGRNAPLAKKASPWMLAGCVALWVFILLATFASCSGLAFLF